MKSQTSTKKVEILSLEEILICYKIGKITLSEASFLINRLPTYNKRKK